MIKQLSFFYAKQFSIDYMQMRKNMTAILKFVFVIILFISLLLLVTKGYREPFSSFTEGPTCKQDIDCPSISCVNPQVPKCIMFECHCKYVPSTLK